MPEEWISVVSVLRFFIHTSCVGRREGGCRIWFEGACGGQCSMLSECCAAACVLHEGFHKIFYKILTGQISSDIYTSPFNFTWLEIHNEQHVTFFIWRCVDGIY